MGSEHYCLRWNNHQSNLLGVFSQLLQDESLVDVTLACSEGASIRAHKVVLSACSSYFQSLFLDHPSRHPIVILKDVHFSELRTLVEFMYKGEVNVQYCQLSALLKTAESLKVKGLAEMTNQSTALRENEHEQERLRPPTHPICKSEPIDATKRIDAERLTPSPPPRLMRTTPSPLSLYPRKSNRDYGEPPVSLLNSDHHHTTPVPQIPPDERSKTPDDDDAMSNDVGINMTINTNSTNSLPPSVVVQPSTIFMSTQHQQQIQHLHQHQLQPPPPPPTTLLQQQQQQQQQQQSLSDCRPPSGGGGGSSGSGGAVGSGGSGGVSGCGVTTTATTTSSSSTASSSGQQQHASISCATDITSPNLSSEPIAGPSGLGPVQSVPLSLKKEIDWDRSDEKSVSDSPTDYRHSHELEATDPHGVLGPMHDQSGAPIYQCMYCCASFPHQNKLTRHILSHSLETLKYRESTHLLHLTNFQHELPPQHFGHRTVPPLETLEPPDGTSAMDIEFAAAAAAVSANSASSSDQVVLCKFCGKSFPDVSSLITHLPVHTGDRPFKCEFCGKAFKLRHHMKDHCRVHTGERPFRCSMCGKTFSRSTILKAHEKTHFPKYVRKFLSPSPVETKDEPPQ